MEKPFKFFALHKQTREVREFNNMALRPYHFLGKEYEWIIYEDTRYPAKIRLYNYIYKIKPFKYEPFKGTEIGKSIPILNF